MINQPSISINGVELPPGQAMVMIIATERLYEDLTPDAIADLGPIGSFYKQQVRALLAKIIAETPIAQKGV